MSQPLFKPSDVLAAVQLVTHATKGLIDVTEGVHHAVHRSMGLSGSAPQGRTSGLTGLVYRQLHASNQWVGQGVERVLSSVLPATSPEGVTTGSPDASAREAVVSALNGVLGDRLLAQHHPLALGMQVRLHHHTLWVQGDAGGARRPIPDPSSDVLVLVHGLCMNDRQWTQHGHDHGAYLARALGCTPIYLHYNTGEHISDNGGRLAALLDTVVRQWPVPVRRLRLVTHSMGGLVARSACHAAAHAGHAWLQRLSHLVFLGTPHHGAPLEQAGAWVDSVLGHTPLFARYAAPFAALGRVRSAGITDLRHGDLTTADWQARQPAHHFTDARQPLPLPVGVACYAVAAALSPQHGVLTDRWLGDGLVPLPSALGQHNDPRRRLAIPAAHQRVFFNLGHIGLLGSVEVAEQLGRWLSEQ